MKYFAYGIMGIMIVAVVAGFFIVGSPHDERARKFDEQRVNDLQIIQGQILNYWESKGKLPGNVAELRDDISGFSIPRDPNPDATSTYSYSVKGPETFSLCAVFSRSNTQEPKINEPRSLDYNLWGDNWKHEAGKVCFERKIDKDLYKKR